VGIYLLSSRSRRSKRGIGVKKTLVVVETGAVELGEGVAKVVTISTITWSYIISKFIYYFILFLNYHFIYLFVF